MSSVRREGKDVIIFATADDHKKPSNIVLPEPEPQPGLILPNGEINWNCPCLGGMATGPCGVEFREAFSCFHNSEADPKGSDCYDAFKEMHLCMAEYPQLYSSYEDDEKATAELEPEAVLRDVTDEGKENVKVKAEPAKSKEKAKTKSEKLHKESDSSKISLANKKSTQVAAGSKKTDNLEVKVTG